MNSLVLKMLNKLLTETNFCWKNHSRGKTRLEERKAKVGNRIKVNEKSIFFICVLSGFVFANFVQGFTSNSQLAKEIIMHNEPHLLEPRVDCIMTNHK